MTRLEKIEQIDFRLLGVTESLKILTAFDNLLMFPQSARQMKTIKKRRRKNSTLRQFEIFDLYKLRKVDKCLPVSMSSSVAAVPSSTPWRDNLINWKSGDLFFLQQYSPPYPSHKNPTQPRGLLMFAAHGVIKWSFFACTRVALK